MSGIEWLAVFAVLLCAAAVLPGTLGILMFTNKIAVSEPGARYIYGKSFWVFVASAILTGIVALQTEVYSWVIIGCAAAYLGVMVFGFFMHTKLMFKPIREPIFISLEEALEKFGPDEEVVGVIDGSGQPWAFVARLARRPHIVYQPDGNAPFIMTHCILAHSSMSYAMEDKFNQPDITITAALANNMVFYEKTNQCSVIQLQNQSLDASLPLKTIPTVAVKLRTWQALYPESKIWMRSIEWRDIFYLKLLARADVIDPNSPVMVYPLQHGLDKRLPMKSQVIGVHTGGESKTYPGELFKDTSLIEDEVGGTPLLLVSAYDGDYIQVYDRDVNGSDFTFKKSDDGTKLVDNETGSEWKMTGECVAGAHEGRQLKTVPHYNKIFWYVWSDFHPGTAIYDVASEERTAA